MTKIRIGSTHYSSFQKLTPVGHCTLNKANWRIHASTAWAFEPWASQSHRHATQGTKNKTYTSAAGSKPARGQELYSCQINSWETLHTRASACHSRGPGLQLEEYLLLEGEKIICLPWVVFGIIPAVRWAILRVRYTRRYKYLLTLLTFLSFPWVRCTPRPGR